MKRIETSIFIQAQPAKVWETLTGFEKFPLWNPFITKISGGIREGDHLEVLIQPPGGSAMTFKPVILKFIPNKEFRWKGKLLLPGIFDGEHYFILEEKTSGTTTLTHGEIFSGILVPLFGSGLKKTEKGFQLMNEAVKRICEEQHK